MNIQASQLHPNMSALIPTLEAVTKLLYPYAEGAMHDLRKGEIVALFNNLSRRQLGDPSVVTELGIEIKEFPDFFEPYYKTNWDGKKLKCTSITVRDENSTPIGLVCINFDTTAFETMNIQLDTFLNMPGTSGLNPVEQFAIDWRQQVTAFMNDYSLKNNIALTALSREEKSMLVGQLYNQGLFNYRDAAAYIAQILHVSRTTVYNYLKEGK